MELRKKEDLSILSTEPLLPGYIQHGPGSTRMDSQC